MSSSILKTALVALGALTTLATSAGAQVLPGAVLLGWKYRQPYSAPRGAVESRVRFCQDTVLPPGYRVAGDDWICTRSGPIRRISWCGVVLDPAQLQGFRRYKVSFFLDTPGACRPQQPICSVCVQPNVRRISTDCQNRPVWEFTAQLPTACFSQTAGTHYWVEIAEEDETSARFGVPDFLWSSHVNIKNCPAYQRGTNAAGGTVFTQPIFEDCFQQPTDLSFSLGSRLIIVANPGPVVPVLMANFLDPTTGNPVGCDPVVPNLDGTLTFDPELPDGTYIMELIYPASLPVRRTVSLNDGEVAMVDSFFDVLLGDLDGNGQIGLSDIAPITNNWGRTAP